MNWFDIIFYAFAVIIVVSGAGVIFSKKLMYSAFSLLFTFFGVAGFYVLLNADFIAVTQIMVYIGGILVLIIFGVMLTTRITGVDIKTGTTGKLQFGLAGIVALIIAVFLSYMYMSVKWVMLPSAVVESTAKSIGNTLLTEYFIAFQLAAVLLLVAFIGAAKIARKN